MLLNIPHASNNIPKCYMDQFILSDEELRLELLRMTDLYAEEIFQPETALLLTINISRLVVDVTRLEDDRKEPLCQVGMGKIPMKTSFGKLLRRSLSEQEINGLYSTVYLPFHRTLCKVVEKELMEKGKALIVECHTFPNHPLPYDPEQTTPRLDACVSVSPFHTPYKLLELVMEGLVTDSGISVSPEWPLSRPMVPAVFFNKDSRVSSILIGINRSLFMDEETGEKTSRFTHVAASMHNVLKKVAVFDR